MKKAVSLFALASLVVCFAACRDENPQSSVLPPAESATDSATHPASPGGTSLVPDVTSGTTVTVIVTEGSVAVQGQAIPPGPTVLTVRNGGREVHNLTVEGQGISVSAGDNIDAGGTRNVDVTLKPGTYTFYCPVLNHRENGEQTTITIGAGT